MVALPGVNVSVLIVCVVLTTSWSPSSGVAGKVKVPVAIAASAPVRDQSRTPAGHTHRVPSQSWETSLRDSGQTISYRCMTYLHDAAPVGAAIMGNTLHWALVWTLQGRQPLANSQGHPRKDPDDRPRCSMCNMLCRHWMCHREADAATMTV